MSGIGEASLVLGLISSIIAIYDGAHEIYDAASDVNRLPRKFQLAAEQIPLVLHILGLAERNIRASGVSQDALQNATPILERCKESAAVVKEIFDKTVPSKDATRSERYKKAVGIKLKSNKVKEQMEEAVKSMQLLALYQLFQDAEALKDIQEALEQLGQVPDEEPPPHFVHSGCGPLNAHTGTGNVESYSHFGPGDIYKKVDFSFRKPVGVCLGQVPCIDSKLFVGRESELDEMKVVLQSVDPSFGERRVVLGGTGGIGKTQLAIAYARHNHNVYDSVLWFDAASEITLKDSLRSMAQVIFDAQEPGVLKGEQTLAHVHRWLSDPKNTRWLLIYDNYDDPGRFRIEAYYPPVSHGAIIVTTRRPDLVHGKPVRVQPILDVEENLKILQTRSGREGVEADPHARRLAERLDGLPLALATAGAYLSQSTFTFERYLQEYECRWNFDVRRPQQLQEYQNRTLYTTWDLSYTRLEIEDAEAAKFLKSLAYFDHQSLWYELFLGGLTDDTPQWLQDIVSNDVDFESVMRRLTAYCFLEVRVPLQSWSMHTCVHDWTLAALNTTIDVQQYWYAVDSVGASVDEDDWQILGHLKYTRLVAHARWVAQDRFCGHGLGDNIVLDRLEKVFTIALLLQQQIQLGEAEQMYRRALTGYEKTLGAEHISTLGTVNNLGLLYTKQGKLSEAEQMYRRALAGMKKVLGVDHLSTINTVNNLGLLYAEQSKLNEAEQMYQRALTGYEKVFGVDHLSTLSTFNNLGNLYAEQGKLSEAEQMYRRALAGREKVSGVDHLSTLDTINNLGLLYRYQGKLGEAEQMYQRALTGYEKTQEAGHTSTLSTVNNLGLLYHDQGKLSEAELMYRRALAGYEKALGSNHTSTLITVNNLGKLSEAELMYRRALAGKEKALGANHISTLSVIHNLGLLYAQQGKLSEAEQMYRRALAGYEMALGVDHTSTLTIAHNLGLLYAKQGKLGEAE
ncbi:uncharacterized protein Z518_11115 [Rhinocladiella mackenziei CBS 650.93]|uniref:NACHT-NTPase and P-loop NTPases N-terminal domain-containing protein n=1 Tax=Rhinocladiella mackenziei CBS 650.93 TaxID=1442369 RepID=A0A0D2GMW6_9EURO|nr:uncharacterized protein Z518_11115 [Rhinocladiella mackenziei CBS 650.93]KIW99702.1 hypothetical protein Z518_11115 [Rhinocladiella mackenziei CBS 650.93]